MRRAGRRIILAAAIALIAASPAAAKGGAQWRIGAAKVDTTPPAFNATQDLMAAAR